MSSTEIKRKTDETSYVPGEDRTCWRARRVTVLLLKNSDIIDRFTGLTAQAIYASTRESKCVNSKFHLPFIEPFYTFEDGLRDIPITSCWETIKHLKKYIGENVWKRLLKTLTTLRIHSP